MTPTYESDVYDNDSRYKDDNKLVAFFHTEAVQNNFKSAQEGRPIFEDVVFITIITPGSRDTTIVKANDEYKRRFYKQWEQFQLKQDVEVTGTPLSAVPWLTRSQISEFAALNVKTVEQLVDLPDGLAQKFMGIQQLKSRAKTFLAAAAGEAVADNLKAELAKRDAEIDELKKQMAELIAANKPSVVKPNAAATAKA